MTKRGLLRVYLGAAPGVGKTYAMLDEGRRRAERGTDVVVGFVETHGRPRTIEKLGGLEIIPRRMISYRGTEFAELDLQAVLARAPEVVLIDELAHTNVPGMQHAKRWQDIESLLEAGIDVISNVNIQHLESLNDVVQAITGVPATRDRARLRGARGRTGRTRRHDARGATPANGARQHLPAGQGRRGAVELLPARQPHRASRTRPALARRQRRGRTAALPRTTRNRLDLGDPRAGRRRTDRRPRGRRADPPSRTHRRPRHRRRPARRAHRTQRRPGRIEHRRTRPATTARRVARRQLPLHRRRRHPQGHPGLRPRQQRHPDRHRRQPPQSDRRCVDRSRHRYEHHPRLRLDRRARGQPRLHRQGPRPATTRPRPDPAAALGRAGHRRSPARRCWYRSAPRCAPA